MFVAASYLYVRNSIERNIYMHVVVKEGYAQNVKKGESIDAPCVLAIVY